MSETVATLEPVQADTGIQVAPSAQPPAVELPPPTELSVQDVRFYASDPQDLMAAQGKMAAWARMKISQLENERLELSTELEIAKRNKWRSGSWQKQITMIDRRINYYKKIEHVINDGYVLVPSMPMDVFAVRVKTTAIVPGGIHDWRTRNKAKQVAAGTLPSGEGKNISNDTVCIQWDETEKDSAGREEKKMYYQATELQDVEFPLDLARPVIMEKTAKALAMKAFDEVGVVRDRMGTNRRADPFVLGRIIDPRPGRHGLCFFIAWHIDVSDL